MNLICIFPDKVTEIAIQITPAPGGLMNSVTIAGIYDSVSSGLLNSNLKMEFLKDLQYQGK